MSPRPLASARETLSPRRPAHGGAANEPAAPAALLTGTAPRGPAGGRAGATTAWGRARPQRSGTPVALDEPYEGIHLTAVVSAMSFALDLAEGLPMGHSVRTAMIGMRIAQQIGMPEESQGALFYALLLKDLGSTSNAAELSQQFQADDRALKQANRLVDWTDRADATKYLFRHARAGSSSLVRGWHALARVHRVEEVRRRMAELRGERGVMVAGMLALPAETLAAIPAVDEHWDGHGIPRGLTGSAIPLIARIVGLAQTVEVFEHQFDVGTAYDVAASRRGRWFDPELVAALERFRDDHHFWGELSSATATTLLDRFRAPDRVVFADELRLDTVALAFAKVIDAKSPFTARHSQNVAFLAARTGMELALTRREIRALRRAALLHDVGKLGISNTILDKQSALTPDEMREMQRHTQYTLEILQGVPRFQRFASLAASHHERLDGSGYHIGLDADALTLPMRILAVADVCDALSAERPYRCAMPIVDVVARLDELVAKGMLCPVAVEALTGWFHGGGSTRKGMTEFDDSTSLIGI